MKEQTENRLVHGEKLLRILVFTLIISVMNASMFNVALPTLSQEFQLSPSQVSWVVTAYMIVYAIGSVTFGKLADKYRLKDLLTYGLLFFACGSIVGLVANSYWMVIAGRVLQAVGASVIPATAMLIPVRYFSQEKRGRALGTIAIGLSLGAAMGPIVSGVVMSIASWRFLFCLSLLALLTLPFFRKYLDDERGKVGTVDFIGGGLLGGAVALILLALTQGSWLILLCGIGCLCGFLLRIRHMAEPFINLSLLKNKHYAVGLLFAFMATSLSFGVPFLIPMMLTKVNQLSPIMIGLVMFPGAIVTALLGRPGGTLADKKGNAVVVYLAATAIFVGFTALSTVAGGAPLLISICLILGNIGQAFLQIANSNTISRTLPKDQTGIGMGLFSMVNFISGAAAVAVIGRILDFGPYKWSFNPFLINSAALSYSNILLVLAVLAIALGVFYYRQFGVSEKKVADKLPRAS